MKGSQLVIDRLAQLLRGELAARDQYLAHAQQYKDMGLMRLYAHTHHEMEHETQHAEQIIDRMLFLEAVPDVSVQDPIQVGTDVPTMLKNDLAMEYKVVGDLRAAIALCETEQDYVTRALLVAQLDDTEADHAYWLEQQLGLIDKVGLANYLQSQIGSIETQ